MSTKAAKATKASKGQASAEGSGEKKAGLWQRLRTRLGAIDDQIDQSLPVRSGGLEYRQDSRQGAVALGFDQVLVWVVVALLAWGLVMVYSASIALPDNPRFGKITHYHFVLRHGIALVLGFVAALLAFQIPMQMWEDWSGWIFVLAILLLVLVLIPHVGVVAGGARRWLPLGVMNFQPSELAKFAVLLYAASFMVRKMEDRENFMRAVMPMTVAVAVVGGLLLAEPDMGAFLVIAVVAMGVLFLGGVNMRMVILIGVGMVVAFSISIATNPWRRERIFAYLDPFNEAYALNKGYQLTHSLIAVGRGEIFGVGLGSSVEKLHWLPEAHTDFLLAVIGEEFGFVGVVLIIALFFWLTRRIMGIGRLSVALGRVFSGLVAQGVAVWIAFQAFINIGVNLGALPTKGLTLPFMSFGGSAVLMNMVAVAVVLRIDYENKLLMHGGKTP